MAYLLRNNWPWTLLAFLIGAILTWFLLNRRPAAAPPVEAEAEEVVEERALVGAGVAATAGTTSAPAPVRFEEPARESEEETGKDPEPLPEPEPEPEPMPEPEPEPEPEPMPEPEPAPAPEQPELAQEQLAFSLRMDEDEPANDVQVAAAAVPVGKYGEGSADAVAHQGPPDGFTIKGNAQSMLFHTPDSPYYGRTKAEVWFRAEDDAERAGFTKYVRKPRKSTRPRD